MTDLEIFENIFTIRQPLKIHRDKKFSYTYTKVVSEYILENKLSLILATNDAYEDFIKNSLYPIDIIILNSIFLANKPPFKNPIELHADIIMLFERLNRNGYYWSFFDIEQRLLHLTTASIVLESKETFNRKIINLFDKKSIKGGKIKLTLKEDTIHLLSFNAFINESMTLRDIHYTASKDKLEFLMDVKKLLPPILFRSDSEDDDESSEQ